MLQCFLDFVHLPEDCDDWKKSHAEAAQNYNNHYKHFSSTSKAHQPWTFKYDAARLQRMTPIAVAKIHEQIMQLPLENDALEFVAKYNKYSDWKNNDSDEAVATTCRFIDVDEKTQQHSLNPNEMQLLWQMVNSLVQKVAEYDRSYLITMFLANRLQIPICDGSGTF